MEFKLSNDKKNSFTQWDVGQYLIPIDAPASADYYIKYYGNELYGTLNRLIKIDDKILIPDEVLQENGEITIVVRHINDREEHCEQIFRMRVIPCDKPDDYIETEEQFGDIIDKLRDYIKESISEIPCVLG